MTAGKPITSELSRDELAKAVSSNKAETFAAFGSLPEIKVARHPDCVVLDGGIEFFLFNGVFSSNFKPRAAQKRVAEISAPFESRKHTLTWWLSSTTAPNDELKTALEAHGYKRGAASTDVAFDLKGFEMPLPKIKGLEISRVDNQEDLTGWMDCFFRTFSFPKDGVDLYARWARAYGFDKSLSCQNLLAKAEGKPVATATVVFSSGIAGIYSIGVPTEERGKSYGTAISIAAADFAKNQGYRYVVGTGSDEGMQVYRKANIFELGATTPYLLTNAP